MQRPDEVTVLLLVTSGDDCDDRVGELRAEATQSRDSHLSRTKQIRRRSTRSYAGTGA
jgi:hypothetical protein